MMILSYRNLVKILDFWLSPLYSLLKSKCTCMKVWNLTLTNPLWSLTITTTQFCQVLNCDTITIVGLELTKQRKVSWPTLLIASHFSHHGQVFDQLNSLNYVFRPILSTVKSVRSKFMKLLNIFGSCGIRLQKLTVCQFWEPCGFMSSVVGCRQIILRLRVLHNSRVCLV